jgi:hypothetical protein
MANVSGRGQSFATRVRGSPISLVISLACLMGLRLSCSRPKTTSACEPHWQIEDDYIGGQGGGVKGALDQGGTLQVDGRPPATEHVPADQLAAVDMLVRRLQAAGAFLSAPPPDPCPGCSDAARWTTTVTYCGIRYWLSNSGPDAIAGDVRRLQQLVEDLGRAAGERASKAAFGAANHFDLGRVWWVTEIIRDPDMGVGGLIDATWTRRGETRVFDSVWHNTVTDERGTDVLEMGPIEMQNVAAGTLSIEARSSRRRYRGYYEVRLDRLVKGDAFGGYPWEARILESAPPAGQAPERPTWLRGTYGPIAPTSLTLPALEPPSPAASGKTLDDATLVAAGRSGACALRTNGSVVCWASQADDPLLGGSPAAPADRPRTIARPGATGRALGLAVGSAFACVLAVDRSVWCWGDTPALRADPATIDPSRPRSPRRIARSDGSALRAVAIDAVGDVACVVTDAGEVLCWNASYRRRPGNADASLDESLALTLPQRLDPATATVRIGCAMDKSRLACWGTNTFGKLATAGPEATLNEDVGPSLVVAGATPPFRKLVVGTQNACVVDGHATTWCWGAREWGDPYAPQVNTIARRFVAIPPADVDQLLLTDTGTCAIGTAAASRRIICVRPLPYPGRGYTLRNVSWTTGGSVTDVVQASMETNYRCAVIARPGGTPGSGMVACWGFRTGEAIIPGACAPSFNDPDACWRAKPVPAP